MIRFDHGAAAACSLLTLSLYFAPQASAQNLFATTNRTVAEGNPINGSYSQITMG